MASPLPVSPMSGEETRSVGQESCDSNTMSAQTFGFPASSPSTAQRLFDARQHLKQLQTQLTDALRQQKAAPPALTEQLTSEMDAYVNIISRLEQQDREESDKRLALRQQLRALQQRSQRKRDEVDTFHMLLSGHVLGETKEPFTRSKAAKTVDQIRKLQFEIDKDIETLDGLPPRSSGLYTPEMAADKKATIQLLQSISADLEQTNQFAANFINSFDAWIGKVSPQNRLRQQDDSPSNGSGDDSGTGADTENADGDEIFGDDEEIGDDGDIGDMDEQPADFEEDEDM